MICSKCKSEKQFGNFCSECGNRLKEKCPECGKMEPIGRKVCKTKLEKAKKARKEYLKNKVGYWRQNLGELGSLVLSVLFVIGSFIFASEKGHLSSSPLLWQSLAEVILIIALTGLLFIFPAIILSEKWQKQARQKATQTFLQENPGYAEILRKAEKT